MASRSWPIVYCLVTSGEADIDTMTPAQARLVREAEQRTAATVVGVTVVEFLGQPDGIVEYGVPLRRALARVIRRHQPRIPRPEIQYEHQSK